MATPEHTKIINKTARKVFKEYGIVQKGRSRMWLDDHYWFTTLIEFQPSSWSRGTYLNVGVHFNWYPEDYFSFNIGYREKDYCEYKNESQFEPVVAEFVQEALKKVLEYRKKMSCLDSVEKTIFAYDFDGHSAVCWENYHKGVILGLNNKAQKAKEHFDLILEEETYNAKLDFYYDWLIELQNRVKILRVEVENTDNFRKIIDEFIAISRKELKLQEMENNFANLI